MKQREGNLSASFQLVFPVEYPPPPGEIHHTNQGACPPSVTTGAPVVLIAGCREQYPFSTTNFVVGCKLNTFYTALR